MIYLISQIFFCLALVGMVGLLVGWLVRGIGTHQKEKEIEATWRMRLRQRDSMLSKMANELADRRDPSSAAPRPVASDEQIARELDELRRIARDRGTRLAQIQGKVSKRDAQISQLFAEIRRIGGQPAVDHLRSQINTSGFLETGLHSAGELTEDQSDEAEAAPEALTPAMADDPSDRTHPEKISLQQASITAEKEPDELAFIYGISPALEKKLLKIGITRYQQIAAFTPSDIQRTAQAIGIEPGQIEEENWVDGARQEHLAKYGEIV